MFRRTLRAMQRAALAFVAVALWALAAPAAAEPARFQDGDVLTHSEAEGWSTIKVIAVDTAPDGSSIVHAMLYAPTPARPDMATLPRMAVLAMHAPIAGSGFVGWERIGRSAVTDAEAAGFVAYLKHTDFRRYIRQTGQNLDRVISTANKHYATANALAESGRRSEAITEYGKAVDLFPLFYEAIDNRAFVQMELGQYAEALEGFEQSLRVNPDGMSAFFSKGECLMKLGKLDEAAKVFAEGRTRFPAKAALFDDFLNRVRTMQAGSR